MNDVADRLVLAGPILRRTEPDRVHIWIATSRDERPQAKIFDLGSDTPREVGSGTAETVPVGRNFFVHLVAAEPDGAGFPRDRLLGYDIVFSSDNGVLTLDDVGLIGGKRALAYDGMSLPSFFIPSGGGELRVLHGSCRLLHGRGPDALALADRVVGDNARDLKRRPSALFLTGDQIYGDDVADALIGHLTSLGKRLLGDEDDVSLPGVDRLSAIPVAGRKGLIKEHAHFTSHAGENHLMSLGEFIATYLVAWNEANWPEEFPDYDEVAADTKGIKAQMRRTRFRAEVDALNEARASLAQVRRIMANTPTYMMFDDHDVTDDWNLTRKWRNDVGSSALGRRIVANALLAFWAFQAWGNDPEEYFDLTDQIRAGVGDPDRIDHLMWSHKEWSYFAPTSPPIVVMNTRTRRSYDSDEGAARLINSDELDRTKELTKRAGYEPGDLLVLISATPVFALEMAERRQKFLKGKVGPYEIDLEAWHDNLCGLMDLMHFLADDLRPSATVILSGDVHYGMTLDVDFKVEDRSLKIAQFVSSSLKHGGSVSKRALNMLGRALLKDHERVGWEHPPDELRGSGARARIAQRPVNTDEWNEDAPVLLAPTVAGKLGVTAEPDLRERRMYAKTSGPRRVRLIGEHNVGLVIIGPKKARQELLCRGDGGIDTYETLIDLGSGDSA